VWRSHEEALAHALQTREQAQKARILCAQLRKRSLQLRGARRIRGGSHDGMRPNLADLINGSARCLNCLVTETRIPRRRVEILLDWIRSITSLVVSDGRCERCGADTVVYRIG
jgi:hypothetical protein